MTNPSDVGAGRGAEQGGADPTPVDRDLADRDDDTIAPANTTPGVGAVGGATAPVGGLTGVIGGAQGAGGNDEADAGDAERDAFRSGEDEFGASDGPPGGTVRP